MVGEVLNINAPLVRPLVRSRQRRASGCAICRRLQVKRLGAGLGGAGGYSGYSWGIGDCNQNSPPTPRAALSSIFFFFLYLEREEEEEEGGVGGGW